MLQENLELLIDSTLATFFIVFFSAAMAILFGLPVAIGLSITKKGMFCENKFIQKVLSIFVTIGRSIPFVILMVALIPFTRFIVGTSIGTTAVIVPMSIAAIPFFARIVEGKFAALNMGLIEAAESMGCSAWQIIYKVLLPESFSGIVNACTILCVSLVEYSAMAGAVGGSGLGSLAIQYGYYQFNTILMMEAVIVMVGIVLGIQFLGDFLTKKVSHAPN